MDKKAMPLGSNDLRGTNQPLMQGMNLMDHDHTGTAPSDRGVEANTSRHMTEKIVLKDITDIEYGPKSADGTPYRTWDDN